MINDCTAIILAGGDSRRMGRDKATLPFAGKTLMQTVIVTMQQLFPVTLVSVRQIRTEISLLQVCDTQSDGGPLTGLVTALSTIHTPWAFVVGCDMPFVSPALVKQLAAHRAQQQAVIPVVHGQLQPLAAFYSTSCIPMMRANLSLGDKSLLGAIKNLNVRYVDEMQMRHADPQLRSFFDLDTPQDLIAAQGDLAHALLIRHGEVLTPFGLSLSKPIHLSTGSRRTDFEHNLAGSINMDRHLE